MKKSNKMRGLMLFEVTKPEESPFNVFVRGVCVGQFVPNTKGGTDMFTDFIKELGAGCIRAEKKAVA